MSKKVLVLSASPRKGGVWRKGDINGSPTMQQAYEMGKTV